MKAPRAPCKYAWAGGTPGLVYIRLVARIWILTACCAWLWAMPRATAQGDYDALVNAAIAAQASGQFERAHTLFAEAHALAPNARTLRGMGVASYQAGDAVQAAIELEAALSHPERPLDAELRSSVEGLLRRAQAQVATVELLVAPTQAHLQVDGRGEAAPVRSPLILAPGEHWLRFSAAGYQVRVVPLTVAAGTRHALNISLWPEPAPVGPVDAARAELPMQPRKPPRPGPARTPMSWQGRSAFAALGVSAGAGLSAGALFWAGGARVQRIAEECGDTPADACTRGQATGELERARIETLERSVNALLGVAGASLLGAASLFVWSSRSHHAVDARGSAREPNVDAREPNLQVTLGPSSLRLQGSF